MRSRATSRAYSRHAFAGWPLFAGYVADRWGAPVTVFAAALIILAVVVAIRITHPALRETR